MTSEGPRTTYAWSRVLLSALALFILTGGPTTYVTLHVFKSDAIRHAWVMWYPFGAVAIAGFVVLVSRLRTSPLQAWPWPIFVVGAFSLWALLSAIWSVSLQTTVVNALINVGVVAFACWFGWCLPSKEQILSVVLACSTAVALSFAVVVWQPRFGKMSPDEYPADLFQGIFGNRNSLAPVCVLGLLALVGFIAHRPPAGAIAASLVLALLHVYLLRGSSGATSIASFGVSVVIAGAIPIVWLLRRRRVHGAVVVGTAVVVSVGSVVWVLSNVDRLSGAFSRGTTLTGRRPIWSDVVEFIRVHPIRGYGYWAFWERPELTSDSYIRLKSSYGSAHNSALEVMLGLGVVGLVLYLAIGLWAVVGLSRLAWFQPSLRSWWWATVFAFVLVQNLTESFVLWHSYLWVLFVAATLVPFNKSDAALLQRDPEPIDVTS